MIVVIENHAQSQQFPAGELTRFNVFEDTGPVQHSSGGPSVDGDGERELVESVLRDLREAADRWEAVVAQASTITYTVDMGDVHAVANSDGKLVDLSLHPSVITTYGYRELSDRINVALAALRQEAQADYQARYGGSLQ